MVSSSNDLDSALFDSENRPLSPPPAYTPTAQAHEHSLGQGNGVVTPSLQQQSLPSTPHTPLRHHPSRDSFPSSPLVQSSPQIAYLPTSAPYPGRPLLNNGRILVYSANADCDRCHMIGYKAGDPSNPCQRCWSKYAQPYSSAMRFQIESSFSVPPNYQKPLPLLNPPHRQHRQRRHNQSHNYHTNQQQQAEPIDVDSLDQPHQIHYFPRDQQQRPPSTSIYPAFHPARQRFRVHSEPQVFPQNPLYGSSLSPSATPGLDVWPMHPHFVHPPVQVQPVMYPVAPLANVPNINALALNRPLLPHDNMGIPDYDRPCYECGGRGYISSRIIFTERCPVCLGSGQNHPR